MMTQLTDKASHRAVLAVTVALLLSACGSDTSDQMIVTDQDSDQTGNSVTDEILDQTGGVQPEIGAAVSADFIALRVEAENFSASSGGWTLTDHQNIPNILPDPDPPHHTSASGFANMELLPDIRVTHDDDNIGGVTFWGNSGSGPRLEYTLDIPEPGRYMVWVKAFSTGTEDNGIHVGLNGEATPSGERIQWCGGKNNWTWSSAQRVDENHCGVPKTIYLDIENAGNNNIVFYAREDGFEIDQFLLVKDTSNGSADCRPQANDQLRCRNTANGQHTGTYDIPVTVALNGNSISDPPANLVKIDMDLDLDASRQTALVGDSIEYTVRLTNKGATYTATNVAVQISTDSLLTFNGSSDCTTTGATSIQCNPAELAAGSSTTMKFNLLVTGEGSPRVDAQVSLDQTDNNPGNNAESVSITSSPAIPDFDGSISSLASPNAIGLVNSGAQTLSISNLGLQNISGATVELQADVAISLVADSTSCNGTSPLVCTLEDIAPGATALLPVTVVPQMAGTATITSTLSVSGDEELANNTTSATVVVKDEPIASIVAADVAIEAESFYSQTLQVTSENGDQLGWSVNNADVTPKISPDFDQGDSASAGSGSYVEFLPDNRVSAQDPQIGGASNFAQGGESSTLEYRFFADHAGQYYVNARIRANSAEDATIHVGLNGDWPESAAAVTVCNPNGDWQWTNNRQATSCDSGNHATLNIATPGIHTVAVSSGTDGVEVDKLMLRLDDASLPDGLGTEQQSFTAPEVDLALGGTIERIRQPVEDKKRTYEITVYNLDEVDSAYDISVQIEGLDVSHAAEIQGFNSCQAVEESIECKIHSITASGVVSATVDIDDTDREVIATVSVGAATDTDSTNDSIITTYGGGSLSVSLLILLALSTLSSMRNAARQRTFFQAA